MTKYYIRHTDINKAPIEIEEGSINETDFDIALFGRIRLEYGERLNQNLLNLMENFAVGMDPNLIPPTPTPMPSFSPSAGVPPSPTPSIGSSPTPTPNITPTPTPSLSVDALDFDDVPTSVSINDAVLSNPIAWFTFQFNDDGTHSYITSEASPHVDTGSWLNYGSASSYEMSYTFFPSVGSPTDPGPGPGWHDLSTAQVFHSETVALVEYWLAITIRHKINTSYSKNVVIPVRMQKS